MVVFVQRVCIVVLVRTHCRVSYPYHLTHTITPTPTPKKIKVTADDLVYNISNTKQGVSPLLSGYDANDIQKTYLGTLDDMVDVPVLDIGGVPITEVQEQFARMGVEMDAPVLKAFNNTAPEDRAQSYPPGARLEQVRVREGCGWLKGLVGVGVCWCGCVLVWVCVGVGVRGAMFKSKGTQQHHHPPCSSPLLYSLPYSFMPLFTHHRFLNQAQPSCRVSST